MAAKNEGFVESEELGYLTLFRFENVSQLEPYRWGGEQGLQLCLWLH